MFHRRSMLKWISGALGTASAAVVTLPGGHFLAEALRARRSKAIVQRVARLRDLSPGRPLQVAVVGSRRDAWTLYPEEVIGRVWLVRQPDEADERIGPPPSVAAFTAVCPHLGCTLQLAQPGGQFVCPCHRAEFALDGAPLAEPGRKSHAPRGMDALDCRLVRDSVDDDWWVEVTYEKFEQGLTNKVSKA